MSRKQQSNRSTGIGKWVFIGLAVLFVVSIIWSFIYETLMPLLTAGDVGAAGRNLVGFPIILAGTALFAYGGFVFVRDTFGAMQHPQMQENLAQINEKNGPSDLVKRARRANMRLLLGSWKDGPCEWPSASA